MAQASVARASQRHSTVSDPVAKYVYRNVQFGLPVRVGFDELARKKTLGAAIEMCMDLADKVPKQVQEDLSLDKAQCSRWFSDQEGVLWSKLEALMDYCGNDAPIFWMLHKRGYDLNSLRKRETETEQQLRLALEENERMKAERIAERRLISDLLTGRVTA